MNKTKRRFDGAEGWEARFGTWTLALFSKDDALAGAAFGSLPPNVKSVENAILLEAEAQLRHYFEGALRRFNLPLFLGGTQFQNDVWNALLTIPYGETRSYKEIAVQVGREKASRAVGMAVHSNPFAIIVPCHRVIGANGSLTGFAAGLDAKRKLLELEGLKFKAKRIF